MAICKKGYTLETKTCGMVCEACEFYDERTKKERQQAKADAWAGSRERRQNESDINEHTTEMV